MAIAQREQVRGLTTPMASAGRKPSPAPRRSWGDALLRNATLTGASALLLVVAGIGVTLLHGSASAFARFGPSFLWSRAWDPVRDQFGALPSLAGTLVSSLLALLIAVPLAVGVAMFLTELAPAWLARPVSTAVEVLAAIPSIIYGMWGLFVLSPMVSTVLQPMLTSTLGFLPLFRGTPTGIGMLTASIVLALMVLPFIASVARDLFSMVPPQIKEAATGLGATRWEVMWRVVIPYTRSGLVGAVILGLGRALGETMAVTFVIGNSHRMAASLYEPANTIASTLANEFTEASGEVYLSSLMGLALVLFLLTFAILALGRLLVMRSAPSGSSP